MPSSLTGPATPLLIILLSHQYGKNHSLNFSRSPLSSNHRSNQFNSHNARLTPVSGDRTDSVSFWMISQIIFKNHIQYDLQHIYEPELDLPGIDNTLEAHSHSHYIISSNERTCFPTFKLRTFDWFRMFSHFCRKFRVLHCFILAPTILLRDHLSILILRYTHDSIVSTSFEAVYTQNCIVTRDAPNMVTGNGNAVASVSNRGMVRNVSYENEFDFHENDD